MWWPWTPGGLDVYGSLRAAHRGRQDKGREKGTKRAHIQRVGENLVAIREVTIVTTAKATPTWPNHGKNGIKTRETQQTSIARRFKMIENPFAPGLLAIHVGFGEAT